MAGHLLVDKITGFLTGLGIKILTQPIDGPTFLPGLQLSNGSLIIDTERLLYPGDILHEAGHLATMPPEVRETMSDVLPNNDLNQGGEMMAMAWSYAACIYLNIAPEVVFHPQGYKGGGQNLIDNFAAGRCIGLPLLQWTHMAYDEPKAKELNLPPFPHMQRWLREA